MKKIYALLVLCFIVASAMTQTATFQKWPDGIAPVIDGVADDIWQYVGLNEDTHKFNAELPTLNPGSGFQAAWNDTAFFVIVTVNDDGTHCDKWCSGLADWQSDKPEIYFDVNDLLHDGIGAGTMYTGTGTGHTQFAPGPDSSFDAGVTEVVKLGQMANIWAYGYAYVITDPNYVEEYYVRINSDGGLTKGDASVWAPTDGDSILFESTIIDIDDGDADRKRMNWHTPEWVDQVAVDECWNNMDKAGLVTISTVEVPVGISHNELSPVVMFPNPAGDVLNINADFNRAVVYDVLGQQVATYSNVNTKVLKVSDLKPGVYIVSVYKNNQLVGSNRIMKK